MFKVFPIFVSKFEFITCSVRVKSTDVIQFLAFIMVHQFAESCTELEVSLLVHALAISFEINDVQILLHNHAISASEDSNLSLFRHRSIREASQWWNIWNSIFYPFVELRLVFFNHIRGHFGMMSLRDTLNTSNNINWILHNNHTKVCSWMR